MRWLLAGALLVACYRPVATDNCAISCASNTSICPSGTMCDQGLCRAPGTSCSMELPDAGTTGQFCFGTLASISGCLPAAPTDLLAVTAVGTTTNLQVSCANGVTGAAVAYCVAAFLFIHVGPGSTVRFTAQAPLVLVSAGTIVIDGTVDVSSGGAGAEPASCVKETAPEGSGGGGGGGGAAGKGADGGDGGLGSPMPAASPLSGGCSGQSSDPQSGGVAMGGLGGGAIALVTTEELDLSGAILASGGGGDAGAAAAAGGGGAGGGGGGGMIVIDAHMLTESGLVIAEGGGGGGGTTQTLVAGTAGGTAIAPGGGFGGPGGLDSDNGEAGGLGGNGGGNPPAATSGMSGQLGGGGGGGGGVGRIQIETTSTITLTSSPPPS